ncbi:3-phosphoglycerate dehydrogenase [Xylophilus rhododendri]|uniref:3-phosphoglycerate dehydrogenase n=1 Tax=Xylophilus rhododendri TaxID=2697032 RepID=A0A857J9E1_9BURK|nr:hydroxyacid dehydrogenase [Xylophilus rhododendri]QHI99669.1 3-phosphoglycerate dehydrogenase [Xylophilus rhododendri]
MTTDTVLITEARIHPDAVELLQGYRLVYAGTKFTQEELIELCRKEQPVAILARYGKFTEEVLRASPRLRVVGRHGVGMDAIDQAAAKRLGIVAVPALGSNSQAVAEHALGLLLACARRLAWLDKRMHEGHWDKVGYMGFELERATLGIVGCGSIGARVVRFAQAIGMRVIVCDPYLAQDQLPPGTTKVELDELLTQCDAVSLHCPLDDSTRGMLDARRLALLKKGAIVINTARAGLFDEAAMQARLHANELQLGLDCFVDEPMTAASPWVDTPNAVLTPHVGGTTNGGLRGMAVGAAQNIVRHLKS